MSAILTSIRPPIDAYILTGPSIFGRGSALRRIRLKTAAVFGSIDCALQFHSAFPTTPPRRFSCRPCLRDTSALLRLVALHCISGYKLSLTATLSLSPTPLCVTVSVRFRPLSTRKPPLAIPTRKDRYPHSVLQSEHYRHPPPSSHP